MKTKIANALKTRYANLGLGDKAFNGVASFLEKTVTEESGIEAAISADNVKGLLQAIQGETDVLRTAKSTAEAELAKLKSVPPTPKVETDETAKFLDELKRKQQELETKYAESEKKAQKAQMVARVHELMKQNGSTNDFIRNITLKDIEIGDNDTAEALAEKYKSVYDDNFKSAYGDGQIPPKGQHRSEGYKKGDFKAQTERLKADGLLPSES